MTSMDGQRGAQGAGPGGAAPVVPVGGWARLRSRLRYGISLRAKLVLPVFGIACLAIGALFAFAYLALQSSIASIYEARARSVAAVISKSIQEKDYILYYSDELDADIARLLEQYESILGITVVGSTARGFVTVASTDPTRVGVAATSDESAVYDSLRGVQVSHIESPAGGILRAMNPVGSGTEQAGIVMVDMSLDEQVGHERRLAAEFGVAAAAGILVLCGLLGLVLSLVVTRPVGRLAAATKALAERRYDLAPELSADRLPGTPVRDEICQLAEGFELMATRIHAHEQELRKLVLLDELTGLYNADHFREQLAIEVGKGKRYGHPTSLLVIDIDGLADQDPVEQDKARVRTATFLLSSLRRVDTVYRVAENRFAGILPETPPAGAMVAAERIRAYTADVTASFTFAASLSVVAMGWDADADVPIADLLHRLTAEEGGPAA
jgi:diguanylate cyclase (GGDEF)-like protein